MIGRQWLTLGAALLLATPSVARAQEHALRLEAVPSDARDARGAPADTGKWPTKFHLGTNEFNLGFTTLIIGGGLLLDYASYNQDSASAAEFDLERQGKIRDSRFILSGLFRTKRLMPWTMGIMYDWSSQKWLIRQTMVNIAAPEIWGQVHIGRMKEGISLYKIMSGYDGLTMERFTFSDVIPLFGDGVKWLAYVPKYHVLWSVGGFTDAVSENETWQTYRSQVVARAVYVRLDSDTTGKVMHVGAAVHVGKPQHDTLQLKSKPEVFEAPNFLDTKPFPATQATIAGLESYYRKGSFLVGGEYYGEWVESQPNDNPFFHGGTVIASWLVTGETRPYSTPAGIFQSITPRRPVTKGGKGALETVIAFSYSDYDADTLSGGKFWRVTPMLNWYLDDHLRLELEYGFGSLNRFGTVSRTEFFQARLQFQFAKIAGGGDAGGD